MSITVVCGHYKRLDALALWIKHHTRAKKSHDVHLAVADFSDDAKHLCGTTRYFSVETPTGFDNGAAMRVVHRYTDTDYFFKCDVDCLPHEHFYDNLLTMLQSHEYIIAGTWYMRQPCEPTYECTVPLGRLEMMREPCGTLYCVPTAAIPRIPSFGGYGYEDYAAVYGIYRRYGNPPLCYTAEDIARQIRDTIVLPHNRIAHECGVSTMHMPHKKQDKSEIQRNLQKLYEFCKNIDKEFM